MFSHVVHYTVKSIGVGSIFILGGLIANNGSLKWGSGAQPPEAIGIFIFQRGAKLTLNARCTGY